MTDKLAEHNLSLRGDQSAAQSLTVTEVIALHCETRDLEEAVEPLTRTQQVIES